MSPRVVTPIEHASFFKDSIRTSPIIVPLELEVLWDSEALDVAFLRAPQKLASIEEANFFDGRAHADAATGLRERWRADRSDTTSLPYFLLGFPNFGHLIEELPRRVETLSSVAIPACVTQFDNQPWDGHCTPAPRMLLVADVGEDGLVDTGMSAMQEDISRRFFHPRSEEGDTFGGFSGGPVVVVGEEGAVTVWLIGPKSDQFTKAYWTPGAPA